MSATPSGGASATTIDTEQPWLGLASFTEETRQYFYGRDEEVAELGRRVQRKLLTVLFGQSGLGKTSILNAGIVPRLRPEGYCPVYVRVDYSAAAVSPSEQIKQAIFRATEATGTWTRSGAAVDGESLWEFLHHRDDELLDAAGKPIIPLLIFDQFEEIFTLAQANDAGRQRAAEFIEDLADLVENRPPKALEARIDADDAVAEQFEFSRADYRILISLREDYLAHLEGLKGAMPSITQSRMRLARMNGEQALAAVMKPGGKLVTEEVAESIVRFVAGGAELRNAEVEPSLLSLICRELNNTRIAQGKNEISVDLLAGSNETILAEFYERALADQPAAVRKVIEDDLLTDSGYRENLAEERVLKAFTKAGAGQNNYADAATTLATLVNRRLLRIEERLDVRRVELTHDVLSGVVKASRQERREREALAEAEQKLAAQQESERITRKALVRARQIAAGCAVLSVVAIASGVYGVLAANRAQKAESEAVKTRALSEASRGEAEKLLVFIVDDFYEEMSPLGLIDVVGALAKKTVEYYKQLPAEARTVETKRNSAIAQSRYAQSLHAVGKTDEAVALTTEATATMKSLREAGNADQDTLIAEARVSRIATIGLLNRADFEGAAKLATDTLASLKPVLAKDSAPAVARHVEAQLYGSLGNAFFGKDKPSEAIDAFRRAQVIVKGLGALELTDLPATSAHISFGASLGEALIFGKNPAEAKASLLETIALGDKLLRVRPGHRPTLASKVTAYNNLAERAFGDLRMAEAIRYATAALRVQEQLVALDPGTTGPRLGFMTATEMLGAFNFYVGRMDETMKAYDILLALGKSPRLDPADALFLTNTATNAFRYRSELGEPERARHALVESQRFAAMTDKAKGSEFQAGLRRQMVTMWTCEQAENMGIDLIANLKEADGGMAEFSGRFGTTSQGPLARRYLGGAYETCGWAALAANQNALAEAFARKGIEYYGSADKAMRDIHCVAEVRAALALALARQGKFDEARESMKLSLAFYRLPAAQKSDDETQKYYHARTLLAASFVYPAEKAKFLSEAARRLDSIAPGLKGFKSVVRVRAQIALEMKK